MGPGFSHRLAIQDPGPSSVLLLVAVSRVSPFGNSSLLSSGPAAVLFPDPGFKDPVFSLPLPTPVIAQSLYSMLANYDPVVRDTLSNGFTFGFDLGFRGRPNSSFHVKNLRSCLEFPEVVDRSIAKELEAGRFVGPLSTLPFREFQINPVGLVPKKTPGEFRMITNLSSPRGTSINDGILEDFVHVSYSSLEDAIRLICRCGPSPFLAKLDIKHAYRLVPIRPSQYNLLCFRWKESSSLIVHSQWELGQALLFL